eukprot:2779939-Prymnesium_polylepis.2
MKRPRVQSIDRGAAVVFEAIVHKGQSARVARVISGDGHARPLSPGAVHLVRMIGTLVDTIADMLLQHALAPVRTPEVLREWLSKALEGWQTPQRWSEWRARSALKQLQLGVLARLPVACEKASCILTVWVEGPVKEAQTSFADVPVECILPLPILVAVDAAPLADHNGAPRGGKVAKVLGPNAV